jgi:medium-chain acyl-[acyl-carrier-protein] hydrolase
LFPAAHQAPKYPHGSAISELSEAELVAHVETMNPGAKLSDNPSLLKLVLPVLRIDLSLCDYYNYQPRPKLSCAINALGGTDDNISHQALAAWREETDGPFSVETLPGGHFFILSERERLLALLSRYCLRLIA